MHSFGIGGIQELDQPGKASGSRIKGESAVERLVKIPAFPSAKRLAAGRTHENPQPALQELDMMRRQRQLQRVEPGGPPVAQLEVFSPKRTHQNFQASVLVKNDLHYVLARQERHQKS